MTIAQLLRFTAERFIRQQAEQQKQQQAVGVASPSEKQQRPAA